MQDNGGDGDVPDGEAPSGREEAAGVTDLPGTAVALGSRSAAGHGLIWRSNPTQNRIGGSLPDKQRGELAWDRRSWRSAG